MGVVIEMPQEIEARLTPETAALNLAVGLFTSNEVTLGQGAGIAGISQTEFLEELCKRKIPYHYDLDDLAEDLKAVNQLMCDRGVA